MSHLISLEPVRTAKTLCMAALCLFVCSNGAAFARVSDEAVEPCNVSGAPSKAEEGKTVSAELKVTEADNSAVGGASVAVGTGIPSTTNTNGYASVSGTMPSAGSDLAITVTRPGESCPCATVVIHAGKKDKSGNIVINVSSLGTVGQTSLDLSNVITSNFEVEYLGATISTPQPNQFEMYLDIVESSDPNVMIANIIGYEAVYGQPTAIEPFELSWAGIGGLLNIGQTTVLLDVEATANYLAINTATGDVFGYMTTTLSNNLVGSGTRRHMQFDGTYLGGVLDLNVSGQLAQDAWTNLGQGLMGSLGVPALDGDGELQPGSDYTVVLTDALANAGSVLVVGFSDLSIPYQGGVLVPAPDKLVNLPTGPNGGYVIESSWPTNIPSGANLWMQSWIFDGGGRQGFSASNAQMITTP